MKIFQEKIQLALNNSNLEDFYFKDCFIGWENCVLVYPKNIGIKWSQTTKFLRSCIYRKSDFYPVSLSFSKFVNFGENPENFPVPKNLDNSLIIEKLDGSTLLVSKFNGEYILRTRGTFSAYSMPNAEELEVFKSKFLQELDNRMENLDTWPYTFVFEWCSKINIIVINHENLEFYLIGIFNHKDYTLWSQESVDNMAHLIGAKRPVYYKFSTIEKLIQNVEAFVDKEGVVLYSDKGQSLHKVKGIRYLALHKMKSDLKSKDNIIDTWFEAGKLDYLKFKEYITTKFDHEIFISIQGEVSKILDGWKEVLEIENGFKSFIEKNKNLSRKDFALKTIASYGQTNRSSFIFLLYDKKELSNDNYKKLLYQTLKS